MHAEFSLVNLLAVLLVATVTGTLVERLGYPRLLGELAAGIIFGPPVLGWLHGSHELSAIAEVGVFLMMLYIGMEIDPRELTKASWPAFLSAIGGFVTPFVLAYMATVYFGRSHQAALIMAIAAGATSLAVQSRILVDLRLLDTRVAHVLLGGALVADTVALIAFATTLAALEMGTVTFDSLLRIGGRAGLFFLVTVLVGWRLFPVVGKRITKAGLTGRTATFTLGLLVGLVFAEMARVAGLHAILGAFLAGLFLREGVLDRKLSHELTSLVHDLSIGFLAPVFFVTEGFKFTFEVFQSELPLLVGVVGVATLAKIVGTALFYLPTRHGWREALTVGFGMNGHGAVEIVIAGVAMEKGYISRELFSVVVFLVFFSTATVPQLLNLGTRSLRRRGQLVPSAEARTGVVVLGAGPLARALARELAPARRVALVDSNRFNCEVARAEGLQAVDGNALEEEVLAEAGAAHASCIIGLTHNPEVNVLGAQVAREIFLVPHTHFPVSPGSSQELAEHRTGARGYVVFGGPVDLSEWDHWVALGQTDRLTVPVTEDTATWPLLISASEDESVLPLVLVRENERHIVHAGLELHPGDTVIALRHVHEREPRRDAFDQLVETCEVVDLDRPVTLDQFFEAVAPVLARVLSETPQTVVRQLKVREMESSTVICPGIAVPHLLLTGEGLFHAILVRCRPGIQFSEHDVPVYAAFLLAGSRDERNMHLRALSAIAQIAQDPEFESRWMRAANAGALREVVLGAKRRRNTRRV